MGASHTVSVLQDGGTPLHVALLKSSFDVAELLIRSGADVNAKDQVSPTPIHLMYHSTMLTNLIYKV